MPTESPRKVPTLAEWQRHFVTALEIERGLSPHTCAAYESDCRRFVATLPAGARRDPTEPIEQHVLDFMVSERRRGQSVRSIRRRLSAIRTFVRFLIGRGVLKSDPSQYLETPKLGQRLPRFLEPEEVDRLVGAIDETLSRYPLRDRALLELLYASGLRVGEATTLTLESVRADLGIVRCFGKGRRERIVPISRRALAAVEIYVRDERPRLAAQKQTDGLFLSRTGRPLGREVVRALLRKCARRAGIREEISPHILRHSLATHLVRGGADLRVVQEILGHVRVETTEIYTHLGRADLKRAHQRFHPRG